ncbi:MAG TPA: nuclear transport factor 2 family protein [Thermoanaerobaculia bacterium]|nr:nuclear transport factor 2 family protein [Thermoanaerobaculia bacterium]
MKRLFLSAALAAAVAGIPIQARAAEPADAIKALNQDFVTAWNAHDAKKLAAVWADDGSLINPFGLRCGNRAEVEKLFENELGGMMKASTYKIDSFAVRKTSDDVMVGDWDATLTGGIDPGGNPMPPFLHHVTAVYRNSGGHWAIADARAFHLLPPPGAPAK